MLLNFAHSGYFVLVPLAGSIKRDSSATQLVPYKQKLLFACPRSEHGEGQFDMETKYAMASVIGTDFELAFSVHQASQEEVLVVGSIVLHHRNSARVAHYSPPVCCNV